MAHVVREKPWGVIDLDTKTGSIFFQQRWRYVWNNDPATTAWTYQEKVKFHNTLDKQIWSIWSYRVRFSISGKADLCKRFKTIPINFDVKWVLKNEHYEVDALKLPAGGKRTSTVNFSTRKIKLDSEDLAPHGVCNDPLVIDVPLLPKMELFKQCKSNFLTVPHEFGHAVADHNDDEYKPGDPNYFDLESLLNIGRKVRGRHLQNILDELNTMVTDCVFAPP
jgi:hypothetical protein